MAVLILFVLLLMYFNTEVLGAPKTSFELDSVALSGLTQTLNCPRGREFFSEFKHLVQV
jgi:hypothetical protein